MVLPSEFVELKHYEESLIFHDDLGAAGFRKIKDKWKDVYRMVSQMAEICEKVNYIPQKLRAEAYDLIQGFGISGLSLVKFSYRDDVSSRNEKDTLEKAAERVLDSMMTGDTNISLFPRFLPVYNAIMTFKNHGEPVDEIVNEFKNELATFQDKSKEIPDLISQIADAKRKQDELLETLSNKAFEVTVQDYAKVYVDEADDDGKLANNWFISSAVVIGLLVLFIALEDKLLPITFNKGATVITFDYIKRALCISFLIYIISFCLKQYNIRKHLQTVNKHRAKTLQSYKLFLQSIDTASADVKNTLMVEVARAIYETGHTGYINTKDDGGSNTSIMEVTKFLSPEK